MSFGLCVAVDVIRYTVSFFLSFIHVFIIFPLIHPVVLVTSDNKMVVGDGDIYLSSFICAVYCICKFFH